MTKRDIRRGINMTKERTTALPDSVNFHQLWDALGSKLIETAQRNLLYTLVAR